MNNQSYILVCESLKSFTYLHHFNRKSSLFEGEHSMLHNRHENTGMFLSKFVLASQGHELTLLHSRDEKYPHITQTYIRFMEEDIEKVVEEQVYASREKQHELQLDKDLGMLQLSIIKMMVERKLEDIKKTSHEPGNDERLMLGKELALEWTLHTIQDVIEKGK